MGHWIGKIHGRDMVLDVEVWYEPPEETHQGLRWHGAISCEGVVKGASGRRLRRDLASPEAPRTLPTDIGTLQIETVNGDRITFRGCGAPTGPLAEAIGE